jgi:hypothetical protein
LDWIKHALKNDLHIEPTFRFQPEIVIDDVR